MEAAAHVGNHLFHGCLGFHCVDDVEVKRRLERREESRVCLCHAMMSQTMLSGYIPHDLVGTGNNGNGGANSSTCLPNGEATGRIRGWRLFAVGLINL